MSNHDPKQNGWFFLTLHPVETEAGQMKVFGAWVNLNEALFIHTQGDSTLIFFKVGTTFQVFDEKERAAIEDWLSG